jgi:hypothetical protein
MRWKGLWFGRLEDGTECSVIDLHCFDVPTIQVVRVRFPSAMGTVDITKARMAAQYLRQRYPELNREEHPSLYTEARFCRRIVAEEEAADAVVVNIIEPKATSQEACSALVMDTIEDKLLPKHPGSFSRLGWRIDIVHDHNDMAWFIFSMSHSIADGTAMHVIIDDYLQAYGSLLQNEPLRQRERLALFSSMPRQNLPFSWFHLCWTSMVGWLIGYLLPFVPMGPKLLPENARNGARTIQKERATLGLPQRIGSYSIDCVELDRASTEAIGRYAHTNKLTVGSMVHSCAFVAIAKRFFQEHANARSLSLPIPLPVNMRKFMIPPLPSSVLAPQQGILSVTFHMKRDDLEMASSKKHSIVELLKTTARTSHHQVRKALFAKRDPARFAPLDGPLLAASMYRTHLSKFRTIQHVSEQYLLYILS